MCVCVCVCFTISLVQAKKKAESNPKQSKSLEEKLASIQKVVKMKREEVNKEFLDFISSGIERLGSLVREMNKVKTPAGKSSAPSAVPSAASTEKENAANVRKTLTQLLNEDDEREREEQQDITRRLVQKMEAQQAEETAKTMKAAAMQPIPGTAHFQKPQSKKATQQIKRQTLVVIGVTIFLFVICILMVFIFKLLGVSVVKDDVPPIPKTKYDA